MVVFEQDVLAVGRPDGRGVERLRRQRDRARLRRAGLIAEHQLVLAARVRQPQQLTAVGRPDGAAIVRAGTLRQVAGGALLRWHGEDVPARFERGADSCRRQYCVANRRGGDLLEMRPCPRQIAGDIDGELPRLPGRRVDQVNVARLLVHDGVRSRRRAHDVEVVVVRELQQLLRLEVVGEDVAREVAVGHKVNGVADPHRFAVVAVGPRQLLDRVVGQVHDPDRMRAPAAVVPPLAALVLRPLRREHGRGNLLVGDSAAVGRVGAAERARHRQRLGQASGQVDRPETEERIRARRRQCRPARREDDAPAIRRPSAHAVHARVIGETDGIAPGRGDDVDVGVPVHRRGERDAGSVGREPGIGFGLRRGGQPARAAAGARRCPQVAGVLEGDLGAADGRAAQQPSALGRRVPDNRQRETESEDSRSTTNHIVPPGPVSDWCLTPV